MEVIRTELIAKRRATDEQWLALITTMGGFYYSKSPAFVSESFCTFAPGKDYCTGFAFEGEFFDKRSGKAERVADFPYCLDGDVSEVSIETDMPCVVRVSSVLDKSSFTIIMEKPNDEEV